MDISQGMFRVTSKPKSICLKGTLSYHAISTLVWSAFLSWVRYPAQECLQPATRDGRSSGGSGSWNSCKVLESSNHHYVTINCKPYLNDPQSKVVVIIKYASLLFTALKRYIAPQAIRLKSFVVLFKIRPSVLNFRVR